MTDFDGQSAHEIAATGDGIRLRCRTLKATSTPLDMQNVSDMFLIILPLRPGRVSMSNGEDVIFEGTVQPGTIRLVQPGERVMLSVQAEFDRAILFIPGPVFRGQAEPAGLQIQGKICPQVAPLIRTNRSVQRLAPLFEMTTGMSLTRRQMLVQGLAATLMALLLDLELHKSQNTAVGFDEAEFEQVLHFAEVRLGRHLDLEEWAGIVGLPMSEFSRRFQQHVGTAPYAWFMDRRIDLAKRLMSKSELPLVDVALESGFCSQSHFTETFRRRVGTSPGRWRKAQL